MNLMLTLNFLFLPESSLAALFLALFFAMLAFGVWLFFRCKDDLAYLNKCADSLYERLCNKISPETFLKSELDKLSANEALLQNLPDLFVSVGILATFIGLGVSIQGAADLLSQASFEIDKLIDLLGIVAFKFQTSVWGLFFSLSFGRFVLFKYFSYRQLIVDKIRDRLYHNERDGIRSLLQAQNLFLEKQFEYQKTIDAERKAQAEHLASLLLDSFSTLNHNFDNFASSLNSNYLHSLNLQTDFHNDIILKLTHLQQSLDSQLALISKICDLLPSILSASSAFNLTSSKFAADTEALQTHIEAYRQTVQVSFDKLVSTYSDVSQKQFNTLILMKQTIEDIKNIYLRCEQQYKNHIDDVQQAFLLKEDEHAQEIRRKLDNMFKITGETFRLSIAKISEDYNSIFRMTVDNFNHSLANSFKIFSRSTDHKGEKP